MAGLFAWEPNLCKKYYTQTQKNLPSVCFPQGSAFAVSKMHTDTFGRRFCITIANYSEHFFFFFSKNAVFITIKLWWNNHPPWSADGNYQQLPEIISATHANTQKTNPALWLRDSYRIAAAPKNVKIYSHVTEFFLFFWQGHVYSFI